MWKRVSRRLSLRRRTAEEEQQEALQDPMQDLRAWAGDAPTADHAKAREAFVEEVCAEVGEASCTYLGDGRWEGKLDVDCGELGGLIPANLLREVVGGVVLRNIDASPVAIAVAARKHEPEQTQRPLTEYELHDEFSPKKMRRFHAYGGPHGQVTVVDSGMQVLEASRAEDLEVESCANLADLRLSAGIRELRIGSCNSLVRLDLSFVRELEVLVLSELRALASLHLGTMCVTKTMSVKYCPALVRIDVADAAQLEARSAEFANCDKLETLPRGMQACSLEIRNCTALSGFGGARVCSKLSVHDCKGLRSIAFGAGGLDDEANGVSGNSSGRCERHAVERARLERRVAARGFEVHGTGWQSVPHLELRATFESCAALESVAIHCAVTELTFDGCKALVRLTGDVHLDGELKLRDCAALERLPEPLRCRGLAVIDCPNISDLPRDLQCQMLHLSGLPAMSELPASVAEQAAMHALVLKDLPITTLPDPFLFGKCNVTLRDLAELESLPTTVQVAEMLAISGCQKLRLVHNVAFSGHRTEVPLDFYLDKHKPKRRSRDRLFGIDSGGGLSIANCPALEALDGALALDIVDPADKDAYQAAEKATMDMRFAVFYTMDEVEAHATQYCRYYSACDVEGRRSGALKVSSCPELVQVGQPHAVQANAIFLSRCGMLAALPAGLEVRDLQLDGCGALTALPAGLALQSLTVKDCAQLSVLPEDTRLEGKLALEKLPGLRLVQAHTVFVPVALADLAALERLQVQGPIRSEMLDIHQCPALETIELEGEWRVEAHAWFRNLAQLESIPEGLRFAGTLHIDNVGVRELRAVSDTAYTMVCSCAKLTDLVLPAAESKLPLLCVVDCAALAALGGPGLSRVQLVFLRGCPALCDLPEELELGRSMHVKGAAALASMPRNVRVTSAPPARGDDQLVPLFRKLQQDWQRGERLDEESARAMLAEVGVKPLYGMVHSGLYLHALHGAIKLASRLGGRQRAEDLTAVRRLVHDFAEEEMPFVRGLSVRGSVALEALPVGMRVEGGSLAVVDCPNLARVGEGMHVDGDLILDALPALRDLPDDMRAGAGCRVALTHCPQIADVPLGLVGQSLSELDLTGSLGIEALRFPLGLIDRVVLPDGSVWISALASLEDLNRQHEVPLEALVPRLGAVNRFWHRLYELCGIPTTLADLVARGSESPASLRGKTVVRRKTGTRDLYDWSDVERHLVLFKGPERPQTMSRRGQKRRRLGVSKELKTRARVVRVSDGAAELELLPVYLRPPEEVRSLLREAGPGDEIPWPLVNRDDDEDADADEDEDEDEDEDDAVTETVRCTVIARRKEEKYIRLNNVPQSEIGELHDMPEEAEFNAVLVQPKLQLELALDELYLDAEAAAEALWDECLAARGAEGVLVFDKWLPEELHEALLAAVDALKARMPADYHPGSDGKVRDIVHPALYPYVRGESAVRDGALAEIEAAAAKEKDHREEGDDEDEEDEDEDYESEGGLDMWGRSFEDSKYQWLPTDVQVAADDWRCEWQGYLNNLDDAPLEALLAKVLQAALPAVDAVYKAAVARDKLRAKIESLRGQRLQVYPKVVDYELAPGESYEGVWHVEGMSHERIFATILFIADRDAGIEGGDILFKRSMTRGEQEHWREDIFDGYGQVDGLSLPNTLNKMFEEAVQPLGSVGTPRGRLVVFPNSHIHKVAPMVNSSDKTQQRRIVVFFLADPNSRVLSTSDVPRQQGVMAPAKAEAHRLLLMKERKLHKDRLNDAKERKLNLCEH